jgi:hypothetical protein
MQDRKIRTTQRSNRLFSSFRPDKKQEVTVPFDEIVLEPTTSSTSNSNSNNNNNNYNNANYASNTHYHQQSTPFSNNMSTYGKSLSSMNVYPTYNHTTSSSSLSSVNIRNSTLSLPGEDSRRSLFGIRESMHESSTSIDGDHKENHLLGAVS